MRRPWAWASLAAGVVLLAYAGIAFVYELGGEDVAEALGAMALLLGAFLAVEGALALRRLAQLEALREREGARGKP